MEPQGGILISASNDLSLVKGLFFEECKSTVSFGRELIHSIMGSSKKENIEGAVFLHYGSITYGISGTERHSFPFIMSHACDVLEKYTKGIVSLNVELVVTHTVLEREEIPGECRYIGFIKEGTVKIKLYEVLDACSARIRLAKMDLKERFDEALRLFYNRDFYLARNLFMEVLQRLPEDGVSRWYLFECEHYLNLDVKQDFDGRMHL